MLKWKHQIKDSTNISQLSIDADNNQKKEQDDDNKNQYSNSDANSLYNELMEIIETEI